MNKSKKNLRKSKLLAYSALSAAALVSSAEADIRIQSTDIVLNFGDSITIDFDGMGSLPGKFTIGFQTTANSVNVTTTSITTVMTTSTVSSSTITNTVTNTFINTTPTPVTSINLDITPIASIDSVLHQDEVGGAQALNPNIDIKQAFDAQSSPAPGVAQSMYSKGYSGGPVLVTNSNGAFYPGPTKFVGVKFNINSNTHYGWVQVEYPSSTMVKIVAFAYEDTPNKTIQSNHVYGSEISAGENHTFLIDEFSAKIAGSNDFGQKAGSPLAQGLQDLIRDDFVTADSGLNHIVSLDSSGNIWAWGSNGFGQLGIGNMDDLNVPQKITALSNIRVIATGAQHSLAMGGAGDLYAWGRNAQGQLGSGNTIDSNSPVLVYTNSDINKVSAGYDHSALLLYDGTAMLWGSNGYGQIGDATAINSNAPITISGNLKFEQISCGGFHTLAVSSGNLYAWGRNDKGQLGLGDFGHRNTPTLVSASGDWKNVSAGGLHSIAQDSSGNLFSFGDNSKGQLGVGDKIIRNTPTAVNAPSVQAFEAGPYHSGAVHSDNSYYYGWGQNNEDGKLGVPTEEKELVNPTSIFFTTTSA